MTTRLALIDGTNCVMRCAAVQTDLPPDDVIVNAGRLIRRAAEDPIGATHVIVAFDTGGASFRHQLYPAYKAHRADKANETRAWALAAREAFTAAGVCCVVAEGFEADDVIATLAMRCAVPASDLNRGVDVHVLSGDSDLLALAGAVQGHVHCWSFGRKEHDEPAIVERSPAWIATRYGIPSPAHLTDYKALVGERGDGVPGVVGIGKVKARTLLAEYQTIEQMIAYGMLGSQAAWARTARELVTLRTDVPLPPILSSTCRLPRQRNHRNHRNVA